MGNQVTKPDAKEIFDRKPQTSMVHTSVNASECPMSNMEARLPSGCPIKKGAEQREVYNVYGQLVNPDNMMPANPNQEPHEDQKYPLFKDRVRSSIPKGGTDETWLYPSEQMFYNALKRKGKGDDVHEGDVPALISIHNRMNELTWAKLEEYEHVCHPGSNPKLLKFHGRPDDLSPLAWVKYMLGYGIPFDRHDWIILRENDEQVRYVIDYYHDESNSTDVEHASSKAKSNISVDVRPAVDSIASIVDRIKFPIHRAFSKKEPDSVMKGEQSHEDKKPPPTTNALSAEEVAKTFEQVQSSCHHLLQKLDTCQSEIECFQSAAALQFCTASIICPTKAQSLAEALKSQDQTKIESAFDAVTNSLNDYEAKCAHVLREEAILEARSSRQMQ
uniref:Holocytochrome c-type synthase n=1 Tax=Albugo laibachii Nc14 TaxID=890382 RepID=F0WR45_9STRA|nr:cytochrome c/c1 heme lyase putative [Albugo laibachii Nc14]|eukprot:CCA23805.1 cytochrome c/c1 heme lyase putative [Albugo laibachii Nc14]